MPTHALARKSSFFCPPPPLDRNPPVVSSSLPLYKVHLQDSSNQTTVRRIYHLIFVFSLRDQIDPPCLQTGVSPLVTWSFLVPPVLRHILRSKQLSAPFLYTRSCPQSCPRLRIIIRTAYYQSGILRLRYPNIFAMSSILGNQGSKAEYELVPLFFYCLVPHTSSSTRFEVQVLPRACAPDGTYEPLTNPPLCSQPGVQCAEQFIPAATHYPCPSRPQICHDRLQVRHWIGRALSRRAGLLPDQDRGGVPDSYDYSPGPN